MIRPVSRSLVGPWLAGNEDWRSNWCCGVAALAATDDGLAGKHAGEQARESGNFDDRKAGLGHAAPSLPIIVAALSRGILFE